MKWPWKDGGYNRKAYGAYSVTKHEMSPGVWEYLAWYGSEQFDGTGNIGGFDSFAEAEARCHKHAEVQA